jgi:hypothetical protein
MVLMSIIENEDELTDEQAARIIKANLPSVRAQVKQELLAKLQAPSLKPVASQYVEGVQIEPVTVGSDVSRAVVGPAGGATAYGASMGGVMMGGGGSQFGDVILGGPNAAGVPVMLPNDRYQPGQVIPTGAVTGSSFAAGDAAPMTEREDVQAAMAEPDAVVAPERVTYSWYVDPEGMAHGISGEQLSTMPMAQYATLRRAMFRGGFTTSTELRP